MAASAEEPVVAGSILERAKKDAETLDWLSIPADQRINESCRITALSPRKRIYNDMSPRKCIPLSCNKLVITWPLMCICQIRILAQ